MATTLLMYTNIRMYVLFCPTLAQCFQKCAARLNAFTHAYDTQYGLHSPVHTSSSTTYTVQCGLHSPVHTSSSTTYTVQCGLHSPVHTSFSTTYTVQCGLHSPVHTSSSTTYTVQCGCVQPNHTGTGWLNGCGTFACTVYYVASAYRAQA